MKEILFRITAAALQGAYHKKLLGGFYDKLIKTTA